MEKDTIQSIHNMSRNAATLFQEKISCAPLWSICVDDTCGLLFLIILRRIGFEIKNELKDDGTRRHNARHDNRFPLEPHRWEIGISGG